MNKIIIPMYIEFADTNTTTIYKKRITLDLTQYTEMVMDKVMNETLKKIGALSE